MIFSAFALFFIALSSIIGNYYYGEANVRDLTKKTSLIYLYRLLVGGMVLFGSFATLEIVWSLADVTMALMTLCNLVAIVGLGKYAFRLLIDYRSQKAKGIKSPVFTKDKMSDIENELDAW